MGRNKNHNIPETPIVEIPADFSETKQTEGLYIDYKQPKGVIIFSAERWYMRILILISNPFRYLFTGRTRF